MIFPVVTYGCWELDYKEGWVPKNWCFSTLVLEKTLESLLDSKEIQPVHPKSVLNIHWKDWCWSWNFNTLATSREELTHWKRLWCWEGLGAGGEGNDRAWDDWMASPTRWAWVWVNYGSCWWTGRPGMLQSMRSQRVGHNWVTELNWTPLPAPSTSYPLSMLFHFSTYSPQYITLHILPFLSLVSVSNTNI